MKRSILVLLFICLASSLAAQDVQGNFPTWQPRKAIRDAVGVKAGFITEGNIYLNGRPYSTEFGLHGGVFFDVHIGKKFFVSPTLDIIDIHLFELREMFFDLSLSLKRGFVSPRGQLVWRPTFSVGYGRLPDIGVLQITNYLTLKTSCEVLFITNKRYSFLMELGAIGFPEGGNSDVEVRANPHLFFRGGVLY